MQRRKISAGVCGCYLFPSLQIVFIFSKQVKCDNKKCLKAFHLSCAWHGGLFLEWQPVIPDTDDETVNIDDRYDGEVRNGRAVFKIVIRCCGEGVERFRRPEMEIGKQALNRTNPKKQVGEYIGKQQSCKSCRCHDSSFNFVFNPQHRHRHRNSPIYASMLRKMVSTAWAMTSTESGWMALGFMTTASVPMGWTLAASTTEPLAWKKAMLGVQLLASLHMPIQLHRRNRGNHDLLEMVTPALIFSKSRHIATISHTTHRARTERESNTIQRVE